MAAASLEPSPARSVFIVWKVLCGQSPAATGPAGEWRGSDATSPRRRFTRTAGSRGTLLGPAGITAGRFRPMCRRVTRRRVRFAGGQATWGNTPAGRVAGGELERRRFAGGERLSASHGAGSYRLGCLGQRADRRLWADRQAAAELGPVHRSVDSVAAVLRRWLGRVPLRPRPRSDPRPRRLSPRQAVTAAAGAFDSARANAALELVVSCAGCFAGGKYRRVCHGGAYRRSRRSTSRNGSRCTARLTGCQGCARSAVPGWFPCGEPNRRRRWPGWRRLAWPDRDLLRTRYPPNPLSIVPVTNVPVPHGAAPCPAQSGWLPGCRRSPVRPRFDRLPYCEPVSRPDQPSGSSVGNGGDRSASCGPRFSQWIRAVVRFPPVAGRHDRGRTETPASVWPTRYAAEPDPDPARRVTGGVAVGTATVAGDSWLGASSSRRSAAGGSAAQAPRCPAQAFRGFVAQCVGRLSPRSLRLLALAPRARTAVPPGPAGELQVRGGRAVRLPAVPGASVGSPESASLGGTRGESAIVRRGAVVPPFRRAEAPVAGSLRASCAGAVVSVRRGEASTRRGCIVVTTAGRCGSCTGGVGSGRARSTVELDWGCATGSMFWAVRRRGSG